MCTRGAGHSAALGDGVEYIFSGCPIAFFNIALVTATEVSAGRLQAQAQQRRGYAEAAMRHALARAAKVHGDAPTFLHATDAGRPIYARMG